MATGDGTQLKTLIGYGDGEGVAMWYYIGWTVEIKSGVGQGLCHLASSQARRGGNPSHLRDRGHPWLYGKYKVSQGYLSPKIKNKTSSINDILRGHSVHPEMRKAFSRTWSHEGHLLWSYGWNTLRLPKLEALSTTCKWWTPTTA